MDGMTEKFSVFDFFNLLIAGIVFLILLGICHYPQAGILIAAISSLIEPSCLFLIIAVVAFVAFALVVGAVLQVIGYGVIQKKINWQQGIIRKCLEKDELFQNEIRLNNIQRRANEYLQLPEDNTQFTNEQCEAFVAYCVYSLYVKELDKKPEKLRETQGLSELLTCVFFSTPMISILIYFIQCVLFCRVVANVYYVDFTYVVCIALSFTFYCRYKISCKNRLRLVISIFDAYEKDKENEGI